MSKKADHPELSVHSGTSGTMLFFQHPNRWEGPAYDHLETLPSIVEAVPTQMYKQLQILPIHPADFRSRQDIFHFL